MASVNWVPLESNPDTMNLFMESVGVPVSWKAVDVLGLDEDLLAMVPSPTLAVILLFPEEVKNNKAETSDLPEGVYFMKQTVGNACGCVALMHAIGNNEDKLGIAADSIVGKFLAATKGQNPDERGESLKNSAELCDAHATSASKGQTSAPAAEEPQGKHFVALVQHGGVLYELNGGESAPIGHGASSGDTFLQDAAKVCKEYMARDPENVNFSVIALAASQ